MSRKLLYCSHVYTGYSKIIENAVVAINTELGIVEEVRSKRTSESVRRYMDLGDCIILPGMVNAHCHLEYSAFHRRLKSENSFAKWLLKIAKLKDQTPRYELVAAAKCQKAAILPTGTTTLFDNLSLDLFDPQSDAFHPRHIFFYETIEFIPEKANQEFSHLTSRLAKGQQHAGIGPHSPYSVSPELLILCCEYATLFNMPLSIHVSETWEEVQFFMKGNGPIFDKKQLNNSLSDHWQCPKISPIKYLDSIGVLKYRPFLIHAGCLCDGDIEIIRNNCCTVIFCPGSHRYFERGKYPLLDFLKAGIPVGIGTDSLASNDTLNIVNELKIIIETVPSINTETLINLGSWLPNGTFSEWQKGGINPGKVADLSIWDWPYKNLMDWIQDDGRCWQDSYVNGQRLHNIS